ncbi:MAG TPA: alpha-isopropylmalate synthase regulatory domain-containing protein, partial [Candidatus Obscuribacterales bacterium]
DPADVGRTYESVIRVNSQSGKGGIAFLLERDYNLVLPQRLQIEFSRIVQQAVDTHGQEMAAADLWKLFEQEYLQAVSPLKYLTHQLTEADSQQMISVTLERDSQPVALQGQGNGPIDAFLQALNLDIRVAHYEEHSLNQGSDSAAIAYVEVTSDRIAGSLHGVGVHSNIVTASLLAILSGVNRVLSRSEK